MRIISGKYRSIQIPMPKGGTIRPTTDRAREGLFNVLSNRFDFEDIRVLDLFAGSGSVSVEFASRGAEDIIAVEKNARVVKQLKSFTAKIGIDEIKYVISDVDRFLSRYDKDPFDLVFADPPYMMPELPELPHKVLTSGILKPGGSFILEHHKGTKWTSVQPSEQREYGQSVFSFFSN